jgi:glycosyltransferase involved in cell wall biosynthesis
LRIALVALQVRGPMGQYIDALIEPLSEQIEVHLFVPEHYTGKTGKAIVHLFYTGLNKTKALFRLLNPYLGWNLWQQIVNIQPDILHIFNGEGYPWSLLWAYWASRKKLPMLVSVHDPEAHPGNILEAINSYLGRFTIPKANGVHIHSQLFLEVIMKRKVSPEKVSIIPHGSIANRFTFYSKKGVVRENIALFFGRLEAYKGLDLLVEAGLHLKGEFRIIIAGPGSLPNNLLQTIEAHLDIFELQNRYLTEPEVAYLFQKASVCVLPYRQATQSSLPLISAAFGVPVVATSVGAFLEDVPLVKGLLVPPGNPQALAQGIRDAASLKPYYPKEYEFDSLVTQFVNFYKHTQFIELPK